MKDLKERIIEALKKDFNDLYVKGFTTNWKEERLVRDMELNIMSLKNISDLVEEVERESKRLESSRVYTAKQLRGIADYLDKHKGKYDGISIELLEELKLDNLLKESK